MPRRDVAAVAGRKRRAIPEHDADAQSSPEPIRQRRRTSLDEDDVTAENEEDGAYGGDGGNDASSLDQMVKKLVRLAWACEYQRRPIRRADINEKVLAGGQGGRKFKEVFLHAQAQLRAVCGMEMVELPAREKVTVAQKRAAAAKQSQSAKPPTASTTTSTSWILTSILPSEFRNPAIIAPPAVPTSEEDSSYTALYTTLVALVRLSGNSLPHAKLERSMRLLELEDNAPMNGGRETSEKLLKRLERDGYLVRVRESGVTGGDEDITWVVGARGKVEVGDDGVRGLVRTVYNPAEGEEEADLERRIARSLGLGEKKVKSKEVAQTQSNGTSSRKRGRPRQDADPDDDDDDEGDDQDGL